MIGDWVLRRIARRSRHAGDIARDRGDWLQAASSYRRYLTVAPDDFPIRVQLGHALLEAGDVEAAQEAYRLAARRSPDDADLLLCWGHLRKRIGDRDGARLLYARSATIDGNARAVAELAALREPEPAEPEPEPPAAPAYVGRVHGAEGRTVRCVVMVPGGAASAFVAFSDGDRTVGIATLDEAHREGEGYAAKTLVDVDRDMFVRARRMPDGAELDNSPIHIVVDVRTQPAPAWSARLEVVKPFAFAPAAEIALFVTYSQTGAVKPHILPYLRALRGEGIQVLLVAVTERPLSLGEEVLATVAGAVVRENRGDDFAAWAHALKLYPDVYGAARLYLLNDTVIGPAAADRFARLIGRVRASAAHLVGLTESHAHRWHLQGYFLALRPDLLSSPALQRFFDEVRLPASKDDDVATYERRFADAVVRSGHEVDVLFRSAFAGNPIRHDWRSLIARGFPFLSLPALDGLSAPDDGGWREVAAGAGFDLAVIDAAMAAAREDVAHDPDDRLVANRPRGADAIDQPLKIAFYGPWNHAGAHGEVARAIIGAIRRADVRLNLHPISRLAPGEGLLVPAVDIADFPGPPDIAIVQVNPDSWHRLTDAQRDAIRAARKRIGYWTCERTGGLPESWRRDFAAVDRIWAPDRACADLFSAQGGAPVDIIPHAMFGQDRDASHHAPDAVGVRIVESLHATMTARGAVPAVDRIFPRLIAGLPLATADLGEWIRAVPLAADGRPGDRVEISADSRHWALFAPAETLVTPLLARIVADRARDRPDVAIFYGDDVAPLTEHAVDQVRLKPEFDMTLLAAEDYVGAPVLVRGDALRILGGPRAAMKTAAMADLLFRAHAAGLAIARIPEVLLAHRRTRVRASVPDYREMLAAQAALGAYDVVPGLTPTSLALVRRFADATMPAVTLIVPTRRAALRQGTGSYIEQLLAGIAETDWPLGKLTVLVGDDIEGTPAWAQADWPFALRRIETPRAPGERFNYAAKMNHLWRAADTEQIVFMNDDVMPLGRGWLKALLTFALDAGVGGVGARLLFEDGSLQHAGLAPHELGAAHIWVYRRRAEGTYQDWALVHREWSMVTGAVFATRRSLMVQANGFDEVFALEFNDTDLCLRLRMLGYRIVYTPHAELLHAEKVSRGNTLPRGDEVARFVSRWRPWLENDPSWHPLLRRDRIEMSPAPDHDAWYH